MHTVAIKDQINICVTRQTDWWVRVFSTFHVGVGGHGGLTSHLYADCPDNSGRGLSVNDSRGLEYEFKIITGNDQSY